MIMGISKKLRSPFFQIAIGREGKGLRWRKQSFLQLPLIEYSAVKEQGGWLVRSLIVKYFQYVFKLWYKVQYRIDKI